MKQAGGSSRLAVAAQDPDKAREKAVAFLMRGLVTGGLALAVDLAFLTRLPFSVFWLYLPCIAYFAVSTFYLLAAGGLAFPRGRERFRAGILLALLLGIGAAHLPALLAVHGLETQAAALERARLGEPRLPMADLYPALEEFMARCARTAEEQRLGPAGSRRVAGIMFEGMSRFFINWNRRSLCGEGKPRSGGQERQFDLMAGRAVRSFARRASLSGNQAFKEAAYQDMMMAKKAVLSRRDRLGASCDLLSDYVGSLGREVNELTRQDRAVRLRDPRVSVDEKGLVSFRAPSRLSDYPSYNEGFLMGVRKVHPMVAGAGIEFALKANPEDLRSLGYPVRLVRVGGSLPDRCLLRNAVLAPYIAQIDPHEMIFKKR